jgi:hypothetical protein
VKTEKEQLKSCKCECNGKNFYEKNILSKKCELALENFFNENIDLFLHFFKKYDKKQKELEEEEEEEQIELEENINK